MTEKSVIREASCYKRYYNDFSMHPNSVVFLDFLGRNRDELRTPVISNAPPPLPSHDRTVTTKQEYIFERAVACSGRGTMKISQRLGE